MPAAIAGLAIASGVVLNLLVATDVIRTLVVPRGLVARWTQTFDIVLRKSFRGLAGRLSTYERRDRLLSYEGPVRLVAYLLIWIGSAFLGYALIFWPFTGSFPAAMATAGSSMFTLGFVPVSGPVPYVAAFAAAATGLVVVALQIAYLPTIYTAYNRRESLVTMLSSRSGQPPWGPEVLARHALIGSLDDLPLFFREWELWSADVAETHTNYPVLLAFRSPHPLRSWLVALNAVLDAAALYLAVAPSTAPSAARNCLRMGYSALREIASVMQLPYDPDPLPDDPVLLPLSDFAQGVHVLDAAGFPRERTVEDAWVHFRGWRVNYEQLVYALGDRLTAPPGLWSGPRHGLDTVTYAPERPRHRHPSDDESHTHDATAH
jgi:hypothetical protein